MGNLDALHAEAMKIIETEAGEACLPLQQTANFVKEPGMPGPRVDLKFSREPACVNGFG
ncbi:MAG TPA: hypothetical protein VN737_06295 [Bryobacteraceae bacterium]|nr:hypothetical protein [Bryobacteraceae bacterium]